MIGKRLRTTALAALAFFIMGGCGVRVETPAPVFTPGRLVAVPKSTLDRPANMDFEELGAKGIPESWQLIGPGRINGDERIVRSGEQSARFERGRNSNLTQCVDAAPYRNKRAVLSGELKSSQKGNAHLRLRAIHPSGRAYDEVEGENHGNYFYSRNAADQLSSRASGTAWWARYRVAVDIPKDAERVCYAVFFDGVGASWADALSLEVQE